MPTTPVTVVTTNDKANEPSRFDVLCGRGGSTNLHPGNERFRTLVAKYKRVYVSARFKAEKSLIASTIVEEIAKKKGRFLSKDLKTGKWKDIGPEKSRDKTSQALRENSLLVRGDNHVDVVAKFPIKQEPSAPQRQSPPAATVPSLAAPLTAPTPASAAAYWYPPRPSLRYSQQQQQQHPAYPPAESPCPLYHHHHHDGGHHAVPRVSLLGAPPMSYNYYGAAVAALPPALPPQPVPPLAAAVEPTFFCFESMDSGLGSNHGHNDNSLYDQALQLTPIEPTALTSGSCGIASDTVTVLTHSMIRSNDVDPREMIASLDAKRRRVSPCYSPVQSTRGLVGNLATKGGNSLLSPLGSWDTSMLIGVFDDDDNNTVGIDAEPVETTGYKQASDVTVEWQGHEVQPISV